MDNHPESSAKILFVDDEDSVLRALKREMRGQVVDLTTCNDPLEALEAVRKDQYSLIVTDNRMPGMTGVELLEEVKKISPDTYRIMLTGYTDIDSAIQAINKGEIHRFLTKPWDKNVLLETIQQGLESYELKARNRRLTEQLEATNRLLTSHNIELQDIATRDQMTMLYNHAEFQKTLDRQIKLFRRDYQPFSLAMGDIDNFKSVNDTYGHPAGDEVIRTMAKIFIKSLRDEVDTICRYGGEEFAIIMRNTVETKAVMVIERMLEKIRNAAIEIPGKKLAVTMSFGVGQCSPEHTKEVLVSSVDRALYHAKRNGKDQAIPLSVLN